MGALVNKWFKGSNVDVLQWPSQSPDLNPIQNLWKVLKTIDYVQKSSNLKDLETFTKEEWEKIPVETCQRFSNKSFSIKYSLCI